jgi:hypothetical protein
VCDDDPDLLKKTWAFSTFTLPIPLVPAPRIVIPKSRQLALKRAGQRPTFSSRNFFNMASNLFFFFLLLLLAFCSRLIPVVLLG